MPMTSGTCCVVNQHCDSPANLISPQLIRTTCYVCGQHVCRAKGCSITTTQYAKGQKVRICAHCAEDASSPAKGPSYATRIDADIYEGSGYAQAAQSIREGTSQARWRSSPLPNRPE